MFWGVFRNKASNSIKDAFNTLKEISGSPYRASARAYTIQGDIYHTQGKYDEAHTSYIKAEEEYEAILANKKIAEVGELYLKIARNAGKLRNSETFIDYRNKTVRVFGDNSIQSHDMEYEWITALEESEKEMENNPDL